MKLSVAGRVVMTTGRKRGGEVQGGNGKWENERWLGRRSELVAAALRSRKLTTEGKMMGDLTPWRGGGNKPKRGMYR